MVDLVRRSIEIILQNQAASGAYIASPNLPAYRYSWFRDGAFIAYAMDLAGKKASASRFHAWSAAVINSRQEIVERAIERASKNEPLQDADILHTRYTPEGQEGSLEAWPNYQLDGLGTWLWALRQHAALTGDGFPTGWQKAARLAAAYLAALWRYPCYDCWEEFPDLVHISTLAAIYGGLEASQKLGLGDFRVTLGEIGSFVNGKGTLDGIYIKAAGRSDVDASLLALATPYTLVDASNPTMKRTVARIESELRHDGGGLHRYAGDTYYGGGEWVLLAAWLGWYYLQSGDSQKAGSLLHWVESQADARGFLPEQIPVSLNAPRYLETWRRNRGEIASPLLWSHANYLILALSM